MADILIMAESRFSRAVKSIRIEQVFALVLIVPLLLTIIGSVFNSATIRGWAGYAWLPAIALMLAAFVANFTARARKRSETNEKICLFLVACYTSFSCQVAEASPINYQLVPNDRLSKGLLFTSALLLVQAALFAYWALRKRENEKDKPRFGLCAAAGLFCVAAIFGLYMFFAHPIV